MSEFEVGKIKLSEYKECDTCSAKPGSPLLCSGCLNNRTIIQDLTTKLEQADEYKELLWADFERVKKLVPKAFNEGWNYGHKQGMYDQCQFDWGTAQADKREINRESDYQASETVSEL